MRQAIVGARIALILEDYAAWMARKQPRYDFSRLNMAPIPTLRDAIAHQSAQALKMVEKYLLPLPE